MDPKIVIHTFSSTSAPQSECCVAFFYEWGKDKEGRPVVRRLPMVFTAATESGAEAAAKTWWAKERAKEKARRDRMEDLARYRLTANS
jgi:hypothetical protein